MASGCTIGRRLAGDKVFIHVDVTSIRRTIYLSTYADDLHTVLEMIVSGKCFNEYNSFKMLASLPRTKGSNTCSYASGYNVMLTHTETHTG